MNLPIYSFGDLQIPQYMLAYNPVDTIDQIRARTRPTHITTTQEDTLMYTCEHDVIWNYGGECSLCNAEDVAYSLKRDRERLKHEREQTHAQISGVWDTLLGYDPSLIQRHDYASAAVREVVNKLDALENEDLDEDSSLAPFQPGQWVEVPGLSSRTGRYKVESLYYSRRITDWHVHLEGSGLPVRSSGLRLWKPDLGEPVYNRTSLTHRFGLGCVGGYQGPNGVWVRTVDPEKGLRYELLRLEDIRPADDPCPTWGGTELPQ